MDDCGVCEMDAATICQAVSTMTGIRLTSAPGDQADTLYPDTSLLFSAEQFMSRDKFASQVRLLKPGTGLLLQDRGGARWFLLALGGLTVLGGPYVSEMITREESGQLYQALMGQDQSRVHFYEGENEGQRKFREYLMRTPLIYDHQIRKAIDFLSSLLAQGEIKQLDQLSLVDVDYTAYRDTQPERYISYQEDCEAGLSAAVAHAIEEEIPKIISTLYTFRQEKVLTRDEELLRFAGIAQLARNGARRAAVPAAATRRVMDRYTARLAQAETTDSFRYLAEGYVLDLCHLVKTCSLHSYSPLVCTVIDRIRNGFQEKMSLNTLAAEFGINDSYLSSVFRRETGTTVVTYITHVRLEYARTMLTVSTLDVSEICQRSGFQDHSYFTRQFRDKYGVSPSAYRAYLTGRREEKKTEDRPV